MLTIHLMFLASGAAALIYQIIWFKQLQFVLGSSTFAVSVTVASFFFGLSLGSWLGGRLADRLRRPLYTYAGLELSVSVVSLAITLFLSKWSVWTPWLTPFLGERSLLSAAVTLIVSLVTLALPTMLMGATLPLLAKYIVGEQQALARRIGLLYGINTLGAVIGCAAAGLLLLGTLGVLRSALVGSAIYLMIAVMAAALIRQHTPESAWTGSVGTGEHRGSSGIHRHASPGCDDCAGLFARGPRARRHLRGQRLRVDCV